MNKAIAGHYIMGRGRGGAGGSCPPREKVLLSLLLHQLVICWLVGGARQLAKQGVITAQQL